jgi:Secretion system C-terminal sorting domain
VAGLIAVAGIVYKPRLGSARTAQAQRTPSSQITGSTVVIDDGTGNQTYIGKNGTLANGGFNGANLGTFDISNFNTSLLLNGGSLVTQEAANEQINSDGTKFTYRIRRVNAPVPPSTTPTFTSIRTRDITLPQTSSSTALPTRTFSNVVANENILTGLIAGSYTLSVFYVATGQYDDSGDEFTLSDPPSSSYQATFTVTGVRPAEPPTSTTWTGGKDDNWFDPANWTQGVPDPGKDATVPDFRTGSTVAYPNIYSNTIKAPSTTTTTIQNPDGTFSTVTTQVPGYDNSTSGPAQTRNLTMVGIDQFQRSIVRLIVGRLNIFGNFSNPADSFIQRENTIISFAGTDQTISGSVSGFIGMEIDGGGTKALINSFTIQAGGFLRFVNGILTTRRGTGNPNDDATATSFIELASSATSSGVTIPAGRLEGESETTYLRGLIKIAQTTGVGTPQNFGNIGLSMTFIGNDPGVVTVTRNTLGNFGSISNGANDKPSIRRNFGVRPSDNQTNTGGLNATMVFSYLDNETRNLDPGNQVLDESKLALFLSTSAGNVFGQLGRDNLNTTTNELTKFGIRSFATFTLSEFTSPLPVTLTAFGAKRIGTNAEITWETVSEQNNRGYEVQVSTDGRSFRTLSFVPSQDVNSNRLLRYRYLDTEANKSGVRYYRLRQIDLDGKENFYGPKVVSFSGSATAEARMEAYPNPFLNDVRLTVQSAAAGKGQLQLLDMTGRVVLARAVDFTMGTNDLELLGLSDVQRGTYMLRVVSPAGKAQTQRIIKQ